MRPRVFVLLALLSAAGAGHARDARFDYTPPMPGAYALPVIRPAADGELLDAEGTRVRLRDVTSDRITLLSFIYTQCAAQNACPMVTALMRNLQQRSARDAALASGLRLVSLSFDPENDTPQTMAAYASTLSRPPPAAEWHFLTAASPTQLSPILDAYGQAVDKKNNPLDPTGPLNHVLRVYLIDRAGRIRNIYGAATLDPRLVLADIQTLLLETPP